MSKVAARLVAAIGVAATLVTCGSPNPEDTRPTRTSSPTSSQPTPEPAPEPTPEPVWPLTGLPADNGADAPALIVKIDNSVNSSPQVGLASADLIVEELVEGGITRLAAMYHSRLPDVVGPVRSIRTTDIGIAKPTGGPLVASGGAGRVLDQMDDAGITVLEEGTNGFSRASDRSAPYNVMVDLAEVLSAAADLDAPREPYLSWGVAEGSGERARGATVTFSRAHTTNWEYDGKVWRRAGGRAAEGYEFEATNLLILRVTTRDAGYLDPGGNPVPETVLVGDGDAVLLSDGVMINGTWSKSSAADPFVLADESGAELLVAPGRTWIELVPRAGSVSFK